MTDHRPALRKIRAAAQRAATDLNNELRRIPADALTDAQRIFARTIPRKLASAAFEIFLIERALSATSPSHSRSKQKGAAKSKDAE